MSRSVENTHACVAEVGDEDAAFCGADHGGRGRADHRRAVLHDGCTAGGWEARAVCGESTGAPAESAAGAVDGAGA
ncbi:hypothetical protein NLR87_26180 [Escherichia coli]|nr:hypothetical protein [Escherichia coli]